MRDRPRLSHAEYTIGWICALPVEMAAAQVLLDDVHEGLPVKQNDHNNYTLGRIGEHNVVIASLPSGIYGISSATTVDMGLLSSFQSVRFGLLVGIGGGMPSKDADIRLGDVVVSKPQNTHGGVVQYDFGKAAASSCGGFERTGMLNNPPQALLTALSKLQANHFTQHKRYLDFLADIERQSPPSQDLSFARPKQEDHLYHAGYEHFDPYRNSCSGCDSTKIISRPPRNPPDVPVIHYGLIASANQVVKNGQVRDKLSDELGAYCVEMEAAGLMNIYPCLVIRGICDYADSHKNKKWQGYAAAVAAAFAKEIILLVTRCRSRETQGTQDILTNSHVKFHVPLDLKSVPAIDQFIGRHDDLERLWAGLQPESSSMRKIAILHGLGGIGKTQLAIRFARCHKEDFTAIFWFDAKDRSAIIQSLAVASVRVAKGKYTNGIIDNDELERRAKHMITWLAANGNSKWLLIFDNVDQYSSTAGKTDSGDGYDISDFIPTADHGSIIITTRRTQLLELGESYPVQKLSCEDTLHLLLCSAGHAKQQDNGMSSKADTKELVRRLDGLPLAVTLAGSYIRETGISVSQYLRHYRASWRDLMAHSTPSRHYPQGNLLSTWMVTYQELQQTHPTAVELLHLLALYDNRDIWFELVKNCARESDLPIRLRDILSHELSFIETMKHLISFSLIETRQGSENYSIHPVVQDWCLHESNGSIKASNSDRLKIMALTSVSYPSPASNEVEKSKLQQRLLPHADQMLRLLQTWQVPPDPKLYGTIHDLGCLYLSQAHLQQAEEAFQHALDGKEKVLGVTDISTLETANHLGLVFTNRGKYQRAEELCRRALGGMEKALSHNHLSILHSLNNLGFMYSRKGDLRKAERRYKQALAGFEKKLGPHHISTLNTINNLGLLYTNWNRPQQAERMYERAIDGFEKVLGAHHTSTLITANNLGSLYQTEGRLAEARQLYERALDGYKKIFGAEHTSTSMIAHNLKSLGQNQGVLEDCNLALPPPSAGIRKNKRRATPKKPTSAGIRKNKRRATPKKPTSTETCIHGLGKVSYSRAGRWEPSMVGWWICCSCKTENNPDLTSNCCIICTHRKCHSCALH